MPQRPRNVIVSPLINATMAATAVNTTLPPPQPTATAVLAQPILAQPILANVNLGTRPSILNPSVLGNLARNFSISSAVFALNLPVTRDKVNVPISPTKDVKATTTFQDPKNNQKKYRLSHYAVAEEVVDGRNRYRIRIQKQEAGDAEKNWYLVIELNQKPLPNGIKELQSRQTLKLKHRSKASASTRDRTHHFAIGQHDSGLQAVLEISNADLLTQVVNALREPSYDAVLVMEHRISVAVPEPKQANKPQLYRVVTQVVETAVSPDPLHLPADLHSYIYADVIDVPNRTFGYLRHTFADHTYYQDEAQPEQFYYLPDAFKVTRQESPPFAPSIMVRFHSADGSLDQMRAGVEYAAAPVVDLDRLDAAREFLLENARKALTAKQKERMRLLPLQVDDPAQIEYHLALPRTTAGAPVRQPRPGVVSSINEGFMDALDLSLDNYRSLYEAMLSTSGLLFTGNLLVHFDDHPDETIPFVARLNELYGELFTYDELPNWTENRISVTITNSIESPVKLNDLPVSIHLNDGQSHPGQVAKLMHNAQASGFPVTLNPGDTLQFEVLPDPGLTLSEDKGADAYFDLENAVVLPDKEAIYDAVLDPSVPASYARTIQVLTFAEMFTPHTDVRMLLMNFENGPGINLDSGQTEKQVTIEAPLKDVILRSVQSAAFNYTLTVIRTNGSQQDSSRSETKNVFVPEVPSA